MIAKFIFALAVAYAGWWLWKGPKRSWTTGRPADGVRSGTGRDTTAALDVLGLKPGASAEDVRAAHRRLLRTVHPDRGGSAELTRQVNAARDLLLGRKPDLGD